MNELKGNRRRGMIMDAKDSSAAKDSDSHWYPVWNPRDPGSSIQELKMDHENKLLDMRNEILGLRHEILELKEAVLKLTGELSKYKPSMDERRRNQMLRQHLPFPFVPEGKVGKPQA